MLYILNGDDTFSRQTALNAIGADLRQGPFADSNIVVLDGRQMTSEQLAAACSAVSLFATERLVVVEGLLKRFEPRGQKEGRQADETQAGDLLTRLLDCIRNIPPTTTLVLIDERLRPENKALKSLAGSATVRAFAPMRRDALRAWIVDRLSSLGGRATPEAVNLLAEIGGHDLWSLSNELDKLMLLAADQVIGQEEVTESLSATPEANEFALMDAIMDCRVDVAHKRLRQVLDSGTKVPRILAFMSRELSLILRAKEAAHTGVSSSQLAGKLRISKGFRSDKIARQASAHGFTELVRLHARLLEADTQIKAGTFGDELAAELLITDLCSG